MKIERKEDGYYEADTCYFHGETLDEAASSVLNSCGCYTDFYGADVKVVALLEVFRRWQDEVRSKDTSTDVAQWNKDRRLKHLGMLDEDGSENHLYYFACTILDHKGLIEWGTSVRGSWPTDEGRAFLETFGSLLREGVDVVD